MLYNWVFAFLLVFGWWFVFRYGDFNSRAWRIGLGIYLVLLLALKLKQMF